MPADVSNPYRPASPTIPDDKSGRRDKLFRRYASAVERALSLFDTALQEWADYISFLGRLLKALQTRPPGVEEVPHNRLVAKRLSQCLNPMLPSGVHQKALEVYALVFATLSTHGLSKELSLYLPGLSPLLSFASLSTRPALLSLFETYIVVLEPTILQPALKAIVLALLPGLEEESSEEFERTHALLNRFRGAVGKGHASDGTLLNPARDRFFWQSLFLATITSSSRRQGALAYLNRNLPRLGIVSSNHDQSKGSSVAEPNGKLALLPPHLDAVSSPEPGLLIRCFVAGLQDEQLLVQRGFLDLLVTHLPLDSAILQQRVATRDMELLVAGAASVVGRREMSLNRRLWVWFLGQSASPDADGNGPDSPESGRSPTQQRGISDSPVQYFEQHGLTPLTNYLLHGFKTEILSPAVRAKPFRICLSLMDRWEIGGLVVPRVFKTAMEGIHIYKKDAPSKAAFSEVLRSANVFFDGIQSRLIWKEIISLLFDSLDVQKFETKLVDPKSAQRQLELIWFVIANFNIQEEEMLNLHIPNALILIIVSVQDLLATRSHTPDVASVVHSALKIAAYLVDHIPSRVFGSNSLRQGPSDDSKQSEEGILHTIRQYYDAPDELRNSDVEMLHSIDIQSIILTRSKKLIVVSLNNFEHTEFLDPGLSLLTKLFAKTETTQKLHVEELMTSMVRATSKSSSKDDTRFSDILGQAATLEIVQKALPTAEWHSDYRVRNIITGMVASLWPHLSPLRPRHNVEAIRCLWRMHHASPDDQLIEATVISLMQKQDIAFTTQHITADGVRTFATLWNHSMTTSGTSSNIRQQPVRTVSTAEITPGNPNYNPRILARPLLLVLESLHEPKTETSRFVENWLQSMTNIHLILHFLIDRLHTSPYLTHLVSMNASTKDEVKKSITVPMDHAEHTIYYMELLCNIIGLPCDYLISALKTQTSILAPFKDGPLSRESAASTEHLAEDSDIPLTIQQFLLQAPLMILRQCTLEGCSDAEGGRKLREACVTLLQRLVTRFDSTSTEFRGLETPLISILSWSVQRLELRLQSTLMDVLTILLKPSAILEPPSLSSKRTTSKEYRRSISQISLSTERSEKDPNLATPSLPDSALLDCLISGLSSPGSLPILDHWVQFLETCLPLYTTNTFQILLPLVGCISKSILSIFEALRETFESQVLSSSTSSEPIQALNILFNAFEQVLARGHDQILSDEAKSSSVRSPEQVQGFFGNMVSGVFAGDTQAARSATANNRLTVLLCFKDAVKISFKIWSWGDDRQGLSSSDTTASASFNYTSIRLRNRTRRALEHLFAAEALECLETLIEAWQSRVANTGTIMNLLHTLEASRPKNAMPTIFNAIYSRTNPAVLDPSRKSSLTSELSDTDLAAFLVVYTRSMDDDALDEVWTDCMTFSRDVLGNPMPHRQTLPLLLEFIAVLGEKIDNTNFGEQRRMRREIGDLFVRLLAAKFTIKPLSFPHDVPTILIDNVDEMGQTETTKRYESSSKCDVVAIIASVLPKMTKILIETERIVPAAATISLQLLMPTFHWKTFPHNVSIHTLKTMQATSRVAEVAKIWKKDVAEAFNDPRFFFSRSLPLIEAGWMPIMRHWALIDKDRMPELLSRLPAPATAGIMFGVGASSARLEADRKAQLNLRRIAFLTLSADDDAFIVNINSIQEKIAELLNATAASSPSSVTRAEVYMVLRGLILKNVAVHLAPLWPLINAELYDALASIGQIASRETYNITCILQAAKLLDTLLILAPDDFQLREWLYVTDTIDAVYRPSNWKPVALVDELAEALDNEANTVHTATGALTADTKQGVRKPLLRWDATNGVPREKLLDQVLRPFLRQLSINAFESTYQMEAPDRKACSDELLRDLFDDSTLV